MKSNQLWTAASKAMADVTVMLIVTLLLAPGAAAASQFKVLHVFTWAKNPDGNLISDAAGNLYSSTYKGGAYGFGVVYKLAPKPDGSWMVSILHSFTGNLDGTYPNAGLIFDAAGNLYGTTRGAGRYGQGVVFKLKPNPEGCWTESVLHSFTGGADGGNPTVGLIFDKAGNLYGTTVYGGHGVVFKLTPNPDGSWTESELHTFTGVADGDWPNGLVFDAAGNLYGTTAYGGSSLFGIVFKLTPNPDGSWTESVLHSFVGGLDGESPVAGLILDAAGNLYGTASGAGVSGHGVVFKLTPNLDGSWTESELHSFTGAADGGYPNGLIFDAAGNLYGTTLYGGFYYTAECSPYGCGVVFKLTRTCGWCETVLHTFAGYAKYPYGGVTLDTAGNLYGTTSDGSNNYGIVFAITP